MARKPSGSPLDDELRRLYTLPLGEFTAERNALAKRLQKSGKAGDKEAADEVKSLAKPSVSAWVVNQLFAREEAKMRALLTAGEHARSALQHTLTVGDAEALREALHDQRELRDELRQRAAEVLEQDVRSASQAILDRVTVNLDALALSPAAAEAAERGWLDADLEPPGFEVLAGLQLAARRPDRRGLRLVPAKPSEKAPEPEEGKPAAKKPAARTASPKDRQAGKATGEEARRRKAEEDTRTREERAEQARREREEARLRERIERAQEKVDRLAEEADSLRRETERSAREAAEAQKAAQEATRRAELAREDADRVRRRADRAAADLARAEKDLEMARKRLSSGVSGA